MRIDYRRVVISDPFHLSGAWNFRDLGGLRTEDGRTTKPGTVFRSSELCALDPAGRHTLLELGVTDVLDLRGAHEIAYNGADSLPDAVVLHPAPLADPPDPDGADRPAPHEQPPELTPDTAEAALEHAYTRFPHAGRRALAQTIRVVADADGAVLIHCAAGKDRAGWITAALLRAAGVRPDDILADYLRSNDAVESLRAIVVARNGDLSRVSDKVLGVHEDFLRAAWRTIDHDYGGFGAYLDAIGVEAAVLARLRARLLA